MEPRTRKSYIDLNLLEVIPFAMNEIIQKNHSYAKIEQRQVDLVNVLKILHCLKESKTFRQCYEQSYIRMKRSFMLYLEFCQRFDLIIAYKRRRGLSSEYLISRKGYQFYRMFTINEVPRPQKTNVLDA